MVIKSVKSKLRKIYDDALRNSSRQIDTSQFEDTLANYIEWTPLKRGGANFQTKKLVKSDNHSLDYKPTIGAILFASVFVIVGFVIAFFGFKEFMQGSLSQESFLMIAAGVIFSGSGIFMHKTGSKKCSFDLKSRSIKLPESKTIHFDHIYALQIISEYVSTNKSSFSSYELNLVLSDGSRFNLIDHGHLESIRDEAKIIAQHTDSLVWDATKSGLIKQAA